MPFDHFHPFPHPSLWQPLVCSVPMIFLLDSTGKGDHTVFVFHSYFTLTSYPRGLFILLKMAEFPSFLLHCVGGSICVYTHTAFSLFILCQWTLRLFQYFSISYRVQGICFFLHT